MSEGVTEGQRRALVVSAHPDDIEFGCAGTIARWVKEGWDVRYVIATSGQKGVQDARQDPHEFGRLREAESIAAAGAVGVTDVVFLGFMDSELTYEPTLLKAIAREFRRHRPHRLVTMDPAILPTEFFVNHPDHRTVGTAALDVTITGGSTAAIFPELLLDEGLEPWSGLEDIWIMGPAGGDEVVDVSDVIERKLEALSSHLSQVPPETVEFMRTRLADRGAQHGYAYAESFRVITRRR